MGLDETRMDYDEVGMARVGRLIVVLFNWDAIAHSYLQLFLLCHVAWINSTR